MDINAWILNLKVTNRLSVRPPDYDYLCKNQFAEIMIKNGLLLLLLVSCVFCGTVKGQTGIRGIITSGQGEPLPYATVYVVEKKSGTVTNEQGMFDFPLSPGMYHVNFQFLGRTTEKQIITVGSGYENITVNLLPQAVQLPVFTVTTSSEDPAYAIMRKAIASARYYRMLVKSYEATIYIKGFGEIKIPKLVRTLASQQPLDTVEYFLSETVSRNYYEYPNTYRQEVLSARSNNQDTGRVEINQFIGANIYEPMFAGVVSPLSPSAFGFYRFKLVNSFLEGQNEISQIRVIPRSRGANVFEGDIYIVEGSWSVYSFTLKTWSQGFEININQMFAPVSSKVWFPVSHRYDMNGSFFGVGMKFQYLASLSDYRVTINDTLSYDRLVLIDEKTERDYAQAVAEEKERLKQKQSDTSGTLTPPPQKFTLKEFRKVMKKMERESKKKEKEPEVILDYTQNIDTMAFKRDAAFWDSLRPIPLTNLEKRPGLGKKIDSVEAVKKSDTAHIGGKFGKVASGLLFGNRYKISKNWWIRNGSPFEQLNFNTVEGLNFTIPIELTRYGRDRFRLKGDLRYGFVSRAFYGRGEITWRYQKDSWRRNEISLRGGNYVEQFNPDEPVHPFINTFYSLLWMDNYMKIYEKTFGGINGTAQLTSRMKLTGGVEWSRRSPLENTTDYTWVSRTGRGYTPNAPVSIELPDTRFAQHEAFMLNAGLSYRPGLRFRRNNGKLWPVMESYPELTLNYTGALGHLTGTDVDFHRLEAGIHHLSKGARGVFEMKLSGGTTFHDGAISFTDFKHFNGNLTAITIKGPMESYRLLDYYRFSTQGPWVSAMTTVRMNRFLLSRIFWLNVAGIRESLSVNYLRTEHSPNYTEVGYGLENILHMIKVEAFTAWEDDGYKAFGIRVGISVGNTISIGGD